MCSAPGSKASFRIEDLLKKNPGKDHHVHKSADKRHVELCDRARATGKKCDPLNTKATSHILRSSLTSNHWPFESQQGGERVHSANARLGAFHHIGEESRRAGAEERLQILGHVDRRSAFEGVDRTGYGGNFQSFSHSRPPHGATPTYLEAFTSAYGNVVSPHHWAMAGVHPPYGLGTPYGPALCVRSLGVPMAFSKRKGGQVRFTPQQTQDLERRFNSRRYLNPEERRVLATQLKLSDRQVKTWFQNRRAKARRAVGLTIQGSDLHSDWSEEHSSGASKGSPSRYRSAPNSPISVG